MEHEHCSKLSSDHVVEIQLTEGSEKVPHVLPTKPLHNGCNHLCSFSNEALSASKQRSKSTRKLWLMVAFYVIFMVVEFIGGLKANSLAILTDAAHMGADVASSILSLIGLYASSWAATPDKSFGYHRLEILGAFLSVGLIWSICGGLIYEAVDRISHDKGNVDGKLMFIIAAIGFFINCVMVFWLGHDHCHHGGCPSHDHSHSHSHGGEGDEESATLVVSGHLKKATSSPRNINIQGAYLHVMCDLIQSIGVMLAGLVLWLKPGWLLVDLVCTIIFSLLTFIMTFPMVAKVYRVLMESTPVEIDILSLRSGIGSIQGVAEVHDLHVWAITSGKNVLACHVVAEKGAKANEILGKIKDYCGRKHHLDHVTIQIEQPQ